MIGPLNKMNLKKTDWVLDIQQQCEKAKVAFFFKQWGGTNKKKTGRMLNGKTYNEMPAIEQLEAIHH